MGTVVLDSSILIALLDPEDAHHAAAAEVVRGVRHDSIRILLPVSVLAEVLVGAHRQGPERVSHAERFVDAIADEVRVIDRPIARAAAAVRAAHPAIRLPDALVLATGQIVAADAVYTGDKRWRAVDPRVRVVGADGTMGR